MNRAWEIVRGVYNTNFNKLSNKKESKEVVKKLWNFINEEIKRRIWIKRCEDIAELEKKEGLGKMILKKRKIKEISEGTIVNKGNNKIKKQKTEKHLEKLEKNNNKIISLVTIPKLANIS
ncbi:unnamed protein product [Rhizophagus irregularis]|uniref:Uncharacterized protein n=1 Tax=Rhizophagus irregularis TaxID=588596 RepID=A0A2I1GWH6_9GLOM|nr:hypothetical protein RhiirA4_467771 [Rhizophagus irregularis]CAB4429228.1 unnamed protein product [Rhizophagus irregularis]CAB4429302.1 unnamed protein product [Rhizophagus irregularis]